MRRRLFAAGCVALAAAALPATGTPQTTSAGAGRVALSQQLLLGRTAQSIPAPQAHVPLEELRPGAAAFNLPVRLPTLPGTGGFEPSLVVDHANNDWVTAHKTYYGIAVSPDATSTLPARASSWVWVSADGKGFRSAPGSSAVSEQGALFGDEGDLAVDAANNVYFVDLNLVSNAFAAWKVTGPATAPTLAGTSNPKLLHATPALALAQPGTDRPFVAAGGDGVVLLASNSLIRLGAGTLGTPDDAYGPGGTNFYVSRDGGRSFTLLPYTVRDSTWCRPAVDRRDARRMYAVCSDGATSLFAVASEDFGTTWKRYPISSTIGGSFSLHGFADFPSIGQGPDGTIYALYNRLDYAPDPRQDPVGATLYSGGVPSKGTLYLMTSRDGGRTWSVEDVTPEPGIWNQSALAVSPKGRLGIQGYYRAGLDQPWTIRAAVFTPGQDPVSTLIDTRVLAPAIEASPPGDFTQPAFGPDEKLRVVYNVSEFQETKPVSNDTGGKGGSAELYIARQR